MMISSFRAGIARPICAALSRVARRDSSPITVLELSSISAAVISGLARNLCSMTLAHYVGVDIVRELIDYNTAKFANEQITFECANVIEDPLPDGELCLIRQVLQHLSNQQISSVLTNCEKFPYLVVTEGVYQGRQICPNVDILHGPDTRVFKHSGVFLDREPFNRRTRDVFRNSLP